MILVKIKAPLYIRDGSSHDSRQLGIAMGSGRVLQMDGWEKGTPWKGIDIWYYKKNDNNIKQYYWGGRVQALSTGNNPADLPPGAPQTDLIEGPVIAPPPVPAGAAAKKPYADKLLDFIKDPNWREYRTDQGDPTGNSWKVSWGHIELEIWKIWRQYGTKGEGVNVAVIDSGVGEKVTDLSNVTQRIYAPEDKGIEVDTNGHGTLTAGVIGGTGASVVYGVAPACALTIIKREGADGVPSELFNYNALKAVGPDIDILNLSITMGMSQRIFDRITEIANNGTLIIAAAVDGSSALDDSNFPANHPGVIPVTALDKSGHLYFQALFNSNTKWIVPGEMLLSCTKTGERGFQDATSAAAPFFSGLMALFIALRKQNKTTLSNADILLRLEKNSSDILFTDDSQKTFTFKLPNPLQTLANLNSPI